MSNPNETGNPTNNGHDSTYGSVPDAKIDDWGKQTVEGEPVVYTYTPEELGSSTPTYNPRD